MDFEEVKRTAVNIGKQIIRSRVTRKIAIVAVIVIAAIIILVSGLMLIYGILPAVFYLAQKMNTNKFLIISVSICTIFLIDEIYNLIFTELFKLPRASSIYKKRGIKYIYFKS